MSADDIVKIVTAIGAIVTPIVVLIYGNRAAKVAQEVKDKLTVVDQQKAAQIESIAKTGEVTHALVNSNFGASLATTTAMAGRIVQLTEGRPGHDDDVRAFDIAKKALSEHLAKQAIADSKDIARAQGVASGIAQEKAKNADVLVPTP